MAALRVCVWLCVCLPICHSGALIHVGPLEVLRGCSAFVTLKHLQLLRGPDCKVEVVLNQPITAMVGGVTPQVFDCSFQDDEVKYEHSGNPRLQEDSVMFRVYRFSPSQTQIQTLLLSVRILDPPDPWVSLGPVPLLVPLFLGLSNPIDSSVLRIWTGLDQACSVRLYGGLQVGQLVAPERHNHSTQRLPGPVPDSDRVSECSGNSPCLDHTRPVVLLKSSCEDFLRSGLRYQHLSPSSPQTDFIQLRIETRERETRDLLESQLFWVPVRIDPALPDTAPRASFMMSAILEVDQFVLTPVTVATLDAEDAETPREQLVFNVTVPPSGGYLTHLEDHSREIRSFSWDDLNHLKIAYQPPYTGQSQPTVDQMEFQVIDSSFQTSAPFVVHISIRTSETNAPRVSWNMGLVLLEGQSRPITWEQLQIVDRDNIQQVALVAVDGPQHGYLTVRGVKSFMFRVADLNRGDVAYHHDDSDTSHDHVVFRISDGRHSLKHRFPISILPRDDCAPVLLHNVALQVEEGGEAELQHHLLAADADSSDLHIKFSVTTAPSCGRLIRRSHNRNTGLEVRSFLQKELVQGQIFYLHSGEETHEDSFEFSLSDSSEPPNESQVYTVVVHVFPVKDQVPVQVSGSVRTLTLREDQVVHITSKQIHFRDPEDPDQDLVYTVTRSCYSPDRPGLMDAGRLFFTDNVSTMKRDHMVPVLKSFSQSAVSHLKVGFMPPVEDIGPDPLLVRFEFSVQNHQGGSVSGLDFNITVLPVDDQKPQTFSNLLRVDEGGSVFVTEEHLTLRDTDSSEDALHALLLKGALHGSLHRQGHRLRPGDRFTLQDLRGLRIRYVHDDSETTADEVSLRISDGTNHVDITLHVQISPVNDEAPVLGGFLLGSLLCNESGSVRISLDHLRASDRDSEDLRLLYMLARTPQYGNLQRSGVNVDRFTQQDLVQGRVSYSHSGAELGLSPVLDTITLIISDAEAGLIDSCCRDVPPPPIPLHGSLPVYDLNVTILPVDNQPPILTVGPVLLSVDEGSFGGLGKGVLGAIDLDTPPDDIIFHVLTPPTHGFIENTLPPAGSEKSNAGVPVESFILSALDGGFINYVQSRHLGVEPLADHMTFSVSDGTRISAPSPLHVVINPTNDEAPDLRLGNITVEEGGRGSLLVDSSDLDVPLDALTFTVSRPPQHGRLLITDHTQQGPALSSESFTLQELRQGVVYLHDGSETLQDSVELSLSDGKHWVLGTAFITVRPVNDQTPTLTRSLGLELDWGQTRVLSSRVLEAEDQDSGPDQVNYILITVPSQGALQIQNGSDWSELSPGQNFKQFDVDMNRVRYTHWVRGHAHSAEVKSHAHSAEGGGHAHSAEVRGHDNFRFKLSDGENETPTQSFYVQIRAHTRGPLQLRTRPAHVVAGHRLVLNSDHLLGLDSGPVQDLVYKVLEGPNLGVLSLLKTPGVPLTTFTQLQLSAQAVCYTHDNSHKGATDSISLVLSNGLVSVPGSLMVQIRHWDRIPPSLEQNAGLSVEEGSTGIITGSNLRLSDPDTAAANLSFRITQMPRGGALLLHGRELLQGVFSQRDVDQNSVSYRHDSRTQGSTDCFHFLPTDQSNAGFLLHGRHRTEPVVFNITIRRLDRSLPSLLRRRAPSTVSVLRSGLVGIVLDQSHLQASDPDSEDQNLVYTIIRGPQHGHLQNMQTGSWIFTRFRQRDLDLKSVVYLVPDDVDVTNDSFMFVLSDAAGNSLPPQSLDLSWSRVDFSFSCFRTCETSDHLQIQVQRRGFSSEPVFVHIQVEESGAEVGTDFTHSSASLLQFDPGVGVKTWSIFPISDELEEKHETFTVALTSAQNCVLGPRTSAVVQIMDPRGGRCDPFEPFEDRDPLVPGHSPGPDLDPVTEIETELIFESDSQSPARGDVPDRLLDFSLRDQAWTQDQEQGWTHEQTWTQDQRLKQDLIGQSRTHPRDLRGPLIQDQIRDHRDPGLRVQASTDRGQQRVWTFHSLSRLRVEPLNQDQSLDQTLDQPLGDAPSAPGTDTSSASSAGGDTSSSEGLCPSTWTLHRGQCFRRSASVASWSSAQRTCSLLSNSSLASVQSRRDLNWFWRFTGRRPFWTDVSDSAHSDVMSLSALKGAPCVLVKNPKNWIQTDCSPNSEHEFICSRPGLRPETIDQDQRPETRDRD